MAGYNNFQLQMSRKRMAEFCEVSLDNVIRLDFRFLFLILVEAMKLRMILMRKVMS
jgi:hypothetical protein